MRDAKVRCSMANMSRFLFNLFSLTRRTNETGHHRLVSHQPKHWANPTCKQTVTTCDGTRARVWSSAPWIKPLFTKRPRGSQESSDSSYLGSNVGRFPHKGLCFPDPGQGHPFLDLLVRSASELLVKTLARPRLATARFW